MDGHFHFEILQYYPQDTRILSMIKSPAINLPFKVPLNENCIPYALTEKQ